MFKLADGVIEELKKFINREIFLTIKGQSFKPKGILKEVNSDFIILGEERIFMDSISSFKPVDNMWVDKDGNVK